MKRAIAILAVMAFAATACGGGGGDSAETTQPPTTTTTTQAAAGDAVNGQTLYQGTCIACHGPDATGVEGLGKSLIGTDFVAGLTDSELVEFLKIGRPTSDPLNTTGVGMAPRGGNPALTDGDLLDIVAFIRSLN